MGSLYLLRRLQHVEDSLMEKASFPCTQDKCGLHVSTVRQCLALLSCSVREQVSAWSPDVSHQGCISTLTSIHMCFFLSKMSSPCEVAGNIAVAWHQSPHLGPVAQGEMPGWVLELKVPVSRLGLMDCNLGWHEEALQQCVIWYRSWEHWVLGLWMTV